MRRFITGPIDEDQRLGDIHDLHVDVLNTTYEPIRVTVRFYALCKGTKKLLDHQVKVVDVYTYFTQRTWGKEHVAVELEHDGDGKHDVLFTVQGRDKQGRGLPTATYRHTELVEVTPVQFVFGGFNQLVAGTPGLVFVRVRVGRNVVLPTTPLRYRATLTECSGDPVAGLSLSYPGVGDDPADPSTWSTVTTDANGQILFGPADGFTPADLPQLTSPLGVTTPLLGSLPEGCYILRVELLNLANLTAVGEGSVRFLVTTPLVP